MSGMRNARIVRLLGIGGLAAMTFSAVGCAGGTERIPPVQSAPEQSGVESTPSDTTPAATGTALVAYSADGTDPAVGQQAPVVSGFDLLTGDPVTVGQDAAVIVFAAAWCPPCNRELPEIVKLLETNPPGDVRVVVVSAWTDPSTPNWPSDDWMRNTIEWPKGFEVLSDDETGTSLIAYGVAGFPGFVAIDADGNVVARTDGEIDIEAFEGLLTQARG